MYICKKSNVEMCENVYLQSSACKKIYLYILNIAYFMPRFILLYSKLTRLVIFWGMEQKSDDEYIHNHSYNSFDTYYLLQWLIKAGPRWYSNIRNTQEYHGLMHFY